MRIILRSSLVELHAAVVERQDRCVGIRQHRPEQLIQQLHIHCTHRSAYAQRGKEAPRAGAPKNGRQQEAHEEHRAQRKEDLELLEESFLH